MAPFVLCLTNTVLWLGKQCVIVALPNYSYLLFVFNNQMSSQKDDDPIEAQTIM